MDPLAQLLGDSPGIVAVREKIRRLVQRQADSRRLPAILIQGETGTGKGLLARTLHGASPRAAACPTTSQRAVVAAAWWPTPGAAPISAVASACEVFAASSPSRREAAAATPNGAAK